MCLYTRRTSVFGALAAVFGEYCGENAPDTGAAVTTAAHRSTLLMPSLPLLFHVFYSVFCLILRVLRCAAVYCGFQAYRTLTDHPDLTLFSKQNWLQVRQYGTRKKLEVRHIGWSICLFISTDGPVILFRVPSWRTCSQCLSKLTLRSPIWPYNYRFFNDVFSLWRSLVGNISIICV